jgi:hypothetical protein
VARAERFEIGEEGRVLDGHGVEYARGCQ